MHEIDLVPQAYRRWLWLRRQGWVFGTALVAVILCLGAARVFLAERIDATVSELRGIQAREQAMVGDRARLDALRSREQELATRAQTLEHLRGGVSAVSLLETVDAALDGRVWFREWRYERSVAVAADRVASATGERGADAPAVVEQVTIDGHALDHAALAGFVRGLSVAPLVAEAQLTDTQVRRYTQRSVVDFSLALKLDGAVRP